MLRLFQKNKQYNKKWFMNFSPVINVINGKNSVYFYVAILSSIVFCSIYGIYVLNPTYTDWLMAGDDLTQHYLGWVAYRDSDWHFPIGMFDTLAYPNSTSVIFTDSIPLFAVIFKILSPILPNDFQYFGLWGIVSFILSGVLSARILKNFTDNKLAIVLSSLLFLYTPIMLRRMFAHTSLAGQWLILLGLEPVFAHEKYKDGKKIYFVVGLMGLLCAFIHVYILLMCGIILLGICLLDILNYKRIKRSLLLLSIYLVTAAGIIGLFGGFSSGMEATHGGLGLYSLNLNAFFNPQGWSCIYKDLPLYCYEQTDALAYLGAGCILGLIISLIFFVGHDNAKRALHKHWKKLLSLVCISVVAIVVGLSPVITMGEKLIVEINLPEFVIKCWSLFRASGRIAWVAVYVVMLCSCVLLCKTMGKRTLVITMAVMLAVQIYDIHDFLIGKYNVFNHISTYNSVLQQEEFWDHLAQKEEIKHVVYATPIDIAHDLSQIYSLTDWALENGMTTSDFYFARSIYEQVNKSRKEALQNLSKEDIFIFSEFDRLYCLKYDLNYYEVDGMIVGYVDAINGFAPLSKSDLYRNWTFGGNLYLDEACGRDTENGRELYSGGFSHSPHWGVPSGNYSVTITGEKLNGVTIALGSQGGAIQHDYTVERHTEQELVLNVELDADVGDFEIYIHNSLDDSILLKEIRIAYAE